MFFATPHYGMGKSDWERLVAHIAAHPGTDRLVVPPDGMLGQVMANHKVLTNVSQDFKPLAKRREFAIVSFQEEHMTELLGDVVSCSYHTV
jgi:hypothetical protein